LVSLFGSCDFNLIKVRYGGQPANVLIRHTLEYNVALPDLREQLQATLGSGYTLESELGGGGMSRVFLALDNTLGRRVVIKVLAHELAADISLERFGREITVAASLQHANIVPLLSAGDVSGIPYYVMPYVDGESLRARMSRSDTVSLGEAMRILRDVANALAYAHDHGGVHRDIKPENVLLSGGAAAVIDFGIAKALSASKTHADHPTLTSAGTSLGTPAYMAPEQAVGDDVDHRADIYAWGVVAYELLAGSHPFKGKTTSQQLVAAHLSEEAQPLGLVRSDVPLPLVSLVTRALAKRADDRPQSAQDLLRSLDVITTPTGETRSGGARSSSRGLSGGWRIAVAALVVLVAGAVIVAISRSRASVGVAADTARSIAVLPFTNLSGQPENEYFSAGMAEEITNALSKVPGLRVFGKGSTGALKARGFDVGRIAQDLGVGTVLQGSVQRAGARVRINLQLLNATNRLTVWSEKYDRDLKDAFEVQDEIARAVVGVLRLKLADGGSAQLVRVETANPEAHALYLQGLYLWNWRTGRSNRQALSYFEQAIAKDSNYARAYAGVALAYGVIPVFEDVAVDSIVALSREAAARALALDSTLAEAHIALGRAEMTVWRNLSAQREFERAIHFDSNVATAHLQYGLLLKHLGRHDQAIREMRRARQLEPQSLIANTILGAAFLAARRYDEAGARFREVIELDSTFSAAQYFQSELLAVQKRFDEAAISAKRSMEVSGDRNTRSVAMLAQVYAVSGHVTEARALLRELLDRSAHERVSAAGLALLYDALGERPSALEWLRRSVAEYDVDLNLENHNPRFDALRTDPRAVALLAITEAMKQRRRIVSGFGHDAPPRTADCSVLPRYYGAGGVPVVTQVTRSWKFEIVVPRSNSQWP
jgi:serine/threonine-protein kinase